MMAACSRVAVLAAVLVLGAAAAVAQPAPPDVAWEFVGADSANVFAFTLIDPIDGRPYGHSAAPIATFRFPNVDEFDDVDNGVYQLVNQAGGPVPPYPGAAWAPRYDDYSSPSGLYADVTGLIVATHGAGPRPVVRSPDGGATWADVSTDDCRGQGSDPRIIRTYGPGRERALWIVGDLCRSDDEGLSWTKIDETAPEYVRRRDLLELPPSTMLPDGRLLMGVGGGVLLSDDSGYTWTATSLYSGFNAVGHDLELAPDPSHPYGGTAYVVAGDLSGGPSPVVLLASDDGGATWEERSRFADDEYGLSFLSNIAVLEVLGDGSLVVGLKRSITGNRELGTVLWSGDGGVTWSDFGPRAPWLDQKPPPGACNPACPDGAWPGWQAKFLRVDREGRVWAGTGNGVWRTTGPAWASVDAEADPMAGGLSLAVYPNPTGGAATVALSLSAPEVVRVAVYDAQGREVAVAFEGAASDGRRVAVETAGLAPGAYLVRATTSGGASATAGLTVVR